MKKKKSNLQWYSMILGTEVPNEGLKEFEILASKAIREEIDAKILAELKSIPNKDIDLTI